MGKDKRKKKKTIQSPSSRRETAPECRSGQHNTAIGCMSGILGLLTRHHSRRRIPSVPATRTEKSEAPPTMSTPSIAPQEATEMKTVWTAPTTMSEVKFSGGASRLASRSPTLPSEIRLSGRSFGSEDSPRRPPALMARLMGLEEPTPLLPSTPDNSSHDSAEEKRRKLLGALERCDEDLRALKHIIDAVRAAEMRRFKTDGQPATHETKCVDANCEQQPSPVSVLDAVSSPKPRSSENVSSVVVARDLVSVFSGAAQNKSWCSVEPRCPLGRRMVIEGIPCLLAHPMGVRGHATPAIPPPEKASAVCWRPKWKRSHAMVESVEEVRDDAVVEERTVAVQIVMELADRVVGDLVDGILTELLGCCSKLSLERVRCKRKLCL